MLNSPTPLRVGRETDTRIGGVNYTPQNSLVKASVSDTKHSFINSHPSKFTLLSNCYKHTFLLEDLAI